MNEPYVHGYFPHERDRLRDQAETLAELLHGEDSYPAGSTVLEVGCGVGAQTTTLARRSPLAQFMSIDISAESIVEAERKTAAAGLGNVQFLQADLFALPFSPGTFDHVFVCFVLEHLRQPAHALAILRDLLNPGGTVTVIEGDHGSTYFHPENENARAAIACQIELQRRAGGNALIGRQLYPLLTRAGFEMVRVRPLTVYADSSRPDLSDGFTRRTFTAMIRGVRQQALAAGLVTPKRFDAGIKSLLRTSRDDGVFCYTFFKGTAERHARGA